MRLTRFTDYSLRVLIYLGLRPNQLVTIKEISEAYNVSRSHLMKVVSLLTRLDYLTAQRGPGGGIQLGQKPEDINLATLVKDMEEDMALAECFRENGQCVITPACQLKDILQQASDAFQNALSQYTLEDLLEPKTDLACHLRIA